jgi:DNA-binding CsgD family transcriptional regulator
MTGDSGWRGHATGLMDRHRECDALARLIKEVRTGHSQALVVRGDPGVGKTVLMDYLAGRAPECRVVRAVGMQSEMELVFSGLHQLCAPILDHLGRLPAPQQDALRTAFGIAPGPSPDRFLVALAVLGLLSEAAGDRPLICLVDDEQWLDRASAQALGFTARRLAADPVALVFAAREPSDELAGLPELQVDGLPDEDARALLDAALTAPLDARVRDLIVAEARGNPLALLELPRGLSPAELAGGFGLPGAAPLAGRIEDSFVRQVQALPDQTRRLLQLAAADPSGDRSLVWRAAGRLGIPVQAGAPAMAAGLVEFAAGVRFRHPLARSAAYRSAAIPDRQRMHAALAEVTDPAADPDRRAWHRAQATARPDEDVALELERSAGRAQTRGGLAAAAAFLERAVQLTANPARHVERILAAAQAHMQAGAFGKALELLATTDAGSLDEIASARVDLLRGQIVFASSRDSGEASSLLLRAANRLAPLDLDLAREAYLSAWMAAAFAAHLAGAGDLLEISRGARALPAPNHLLRPLDLLLDGFARLVIDGRGAAAPTLRQAVNAFASADTPVKEVLQFGWMAMGAADALWDVDSWRAIQVRQVRLARAAGALEQLPVDLAMLAQGDTQHGDFAAADSHIAESEAIATAIGGGRHASYTAMYLAAQRGHEAEVTPLAEATLAAAEAGGYASAVAAVHWAVAILHNGHGRYTDALAAAEEAIREGAVFLSSWALPELIEAASRSGNTHLAAGALKRLADITQAGGTDFGLGIEARCRALLTGGAAAGDLYQQAIDRLSRTRLRPELARTHLLFGEWLRREGRLPDAREQLRTAHGMFTAIGMEAFAERARLELIAAGGKAPKRSSQTRDQLTPQEEQIARLARDGLSNPEIGAQLFLSARTVEWHLRKIFGKLGVGSRRELDAALAQLGRDGRPA